MKVAGKGSKNVRCANCLSFVRPSEKRGLFCTKCYKKPRSNKVKSRAKSKFVEHGEVQPNMTIPLSQFVDIVPINNPINSEPIIIEPVEDETEELTDDDVIFYSEELEVPQNITELKEMSKQELIKLAENLGLDSSGFKYELIKRIADDIGI